MAIKIERPTEDGPHGPWYATLSPREQATVDHAINYEACYAHAGVPGHSAHLLIAKLAALIDAATVDLSRGREVKP